MLVDNVSRNSIPASTISLQTKTNVGGAKLTGMHDRVIRRGVFLATFGDSPLAMPKHSNRCGWTVRQATTKLATNPLVDHTTDSISRNLYLDK